MQPTAPDRLQEEIYNSRAREYDELVRREDCDGNLLPAIERHVRMRGAAIAEVGAGTGRITRLMAKAGARVFAFDRAPAMLEVAREHLDGAEVSFALADARSLPLPDASCSAFIAGWVFGHLRLWMPKDWQNEIDRALSEAERVTSAGAPTIVIETMGTGMDEARAPSGALAEYYAYLENEWGFERSVVRTDYLFPNVDDAAKYLGAFFGESMAERVRERNWSRVPEHTGVWTRRAA
jgi:ubiquinone/menaquinone biosynthesis C-methylase UbiE